MAKRHYNEYYAGRESRNRQEREDGGMLSEDRNCIANMPQDVKMMAYPKTGPYLPDNLDDTIRGIDRQMGYDEAKRDSQLSPRKV